MSPSDLTKKVSIKLPIFDGSPSSESISELIGYFTHLSQEYDRVEMNVLRGGVPIFNIAKEGLEVQFSAIKYQPVSTDEYLGSLGVKPERQYEVYEILKSKFENN